MTVECANTEPIEKKPRELQIVEMHVSNCMCNPSRTVNCRLGEVYDV